MTLLFAHVLICLLVLCITLFYYVLFRVAPYQIALHDGRLIFAPQDTDQVIRLRPPAAPDAPSSPEYVPQEEGGELAAEYSWDIGDIVVII